MNRLRVAGGRGSGASTQPQGGRESGLSHPVYAAIPHAVAFRFDSGDLDARRVISRD